MFLTYETITKDVQRWSKQRGLDKADPIKQYAKLIEEAGELAASLLRGNDTGIIDAIGDILVVITILCQQLDISPLACFYTAYEEIKDRTGQTVNGVFVKDADLN